MNNFMKKSITMAILLAIPLLMSLTYEDTRSITFSGKDLDLFNVRQVELPGGDTGYTLADIAYSRTTMPLISDLLVTFDTPSHQMVRDDLQHYRVKDAAFQFSEQKDALGKGCARFYKKDHGLELQTDKNLWLSNCADLGSFSIEFRVLINTRTDNGILFSRVGYTSGRKNGIEILCEGNTIVARFSGVFKNMDNRPVDVTLQRTPRLDEGRWYHFAVSFDRLSGKLSSYINGKEHESVFVSEMEEPFINVYRPAFVCEDLPPVIIGKNFYGCMDELRVSYRHYEDLEKETEMAETQYRQSGMTGRIPVNREGVITSPVYSFDSTGTMIKLFKWKEKLPPHTFVWMEFRIADSLFEKSDANPRWYRMENKQRNIYLKKINGEYLRGKYYQWRAHLIGSPDGNRSPVVTDISMRYQLDASPGAPVFLEPESRGDESVVLRWKKNVEHDLLGYKIYYGVRSGKYDGVITVVDGKPITNKMVKDENWVTVRLDNEVIEENRALDPSGILKYPLLKNGVLYFFSVTAYDTYKPLSPHNHESKHSKEISTRPFAGSEITQ